MSASSGYDGSPFCDPSFGSDDDIWDPKTGISGFALDEMAAAEPPPVLELRGIARTYPGPPPVTALHAANLTVRRGEHVAIIGPSGSGKSTLLNILGLLDRPSEGRVLLDGIDTATLNERDRTALRGRRIGFVFQAFHLMPHRTTVENVMLAQIYIDRRRKSERRTDAVKTLIGVGLGHRLAALPSTLSGGERQRVAIARALVNRPTLLLADEPTGNLDSQTASTVLNLLEELVAGGLTLLVITHDPVVASRARRTVMIHDGQLTEHPAVRTAMPRA